MGKLLTALLGFLAIAVNAQNYHFTNYSVEQGLAGEQVEAICQDNEGYLWIGTATGLSKFDGINFVNYSIDNGLPDNVIRTLYLAKNGDLWIATQKGVAVMRNERITSFFFEEKYTVNDIGEFQGEIYFASNTGLISLDQNQGKFNLLGGEDADDHFIRAIANYKDSILICGTRTRGVSTWDGNDLDTIGIPGLGDLNIRNLDIVDDILYISARRGVGLFSLDLKSEERTDYSLDFTTVKEWYVDKEFMFGISTNSGAFLIDGEDTLYFDASNGLRNSGLRCMYKDAEDNIWIGAEGAGLMKFSGRSIVSYSSEDWLGSDLVISIEQDTNNNFIFGTFDAGVTLYKPDSVDYFTSGNSMIADDQVWAVMQDELNRTWLGTSRGLSILDDNSHVVSHALSGHNTKIRSIVQTGDGTVLLGGSQGLWVMKNDTVQNFHSDSLNINKLHVLGNHVYCAAVDGLYELELGNYSSYQKIDLPIQNVVFTLTSDMYGNLWIGTEYGLFVKDSENRVYRFPLDESDYRAKSVFGLICSENGDIWVSGGNGVYQIEFNDDGTNYKIRNYGNTQGLISNECNVNALYEDHLGNIWVGTAKGLAKIDLSFNDVLFDYEPPQLYITGIRLFMEDFDYAIYKFEPDSIFYTPSFIEFPYNKNHLTFDFIGINLKDPKSVKYQYQLLGVDEDWLPVSASNYATYSYLDPGEYEFQVRAINKDNLFSSIRSMRVVVGPPFWKTWWFIGLVIIAVFVIIVYIFQSRIGALKQRQENEKLELKNRLLFLEQRSLNASMNRHFIFNSLNSIQYFINSSNKLSANKYLSNFAKLIRKNLDSSAATNFIVTLQEEVERIELYLSLEKMRFSGKFDYEVNVSSSLDTESIEIPSMILQPFVENSIIHGVLSMETEGRIKIDIYEEFGEVIFIVEDNGLGIDNSLKTKQKSIEGDHESKGVEITNRRIELLRRLTGENLLIIGPFQMNDDGGNSQGTKVIIKLGGAQKFE